MTASRPFGVGSVIAPLRRVLLKYARDAYRDQDWIAASWRSRGYAAPPVVERAIREYDDFVDLLRGEVGVVEFLPPDAVNSLDSIYTCDPVVITPAGAVLCRMGKELRRLESRATAAYLEATGTPILGRIEPPGTLEAGGVIWLGPQTVAVGRG